MKKNKTNKKNDNKTLIVSIVIIVALIAIIAGGTYSYWSWSSSTSEQSNVAFTIKNPGENLSATITAVAGDFSNLEPTANTTGSKAFTKKITATYKNNSGQNAKLEVSLKLSQFTKKTGTNDFPHSLTMSITEICFSGLSFRSLINDSCIAILVKLAIYMSPHCTGKYINTSAEYYTVFLIICNCCTLRSRAFCHSLHILNKESGVHRSSMHSALSLC